MNLVDIFRGRQPLRPLMFSYYITHRCNLNCAYCCDGNGKRFAEELIPELSTKDAKALVSILKYSGDTLDVTGGEPLLRNDLEEILAHAVKKGLRTILNTKGIGLQNRPEILIDSDIIVLSIDSLNSRELAKMIGRDETTAKKILESLEFLLKKRNPRKTRIVLSVVATPCNLNEVEEVFNFARNNHLEIQISPEIIGKSPNPILRKHQGYQELVTKFIQAKKRDGGVLGVIEYLRGIQQFTQFKCHPQLMPVIRPDGKMYYPCLENKDAQVGILDFGSYEKTLEAAREKFSKPIFCNDCCHIFCHMALSLLQCHPLSAMKELLQWRKPHARCS